MVSLSHAKVKSFHLKQSRQQSALSSSIRPVRGSPLNTIFFVAISQPQALAGLHTNEPSQTEAQWDARTHSSCTLFAAISPTISTNFTTSPLVLPPNPADRWCESRHILLLSLPFILRGLSFGPCTFVSHCQCIVHSSPQICQLLFASVLPLDLIFLHTSDMVFILCCCLISSFFIKITFLPEKRRKSTTTQQRREDTTTTQKGGRKEAPSSNGERERAVPRQKGIAAPLPTRRGAGQYHHLNRGGGESTTTSTRERRESTTTHTKEAKKCERARPFQRCVVVPQQMKVKWDEMR